jgi:hypothetical protein
MQLQHGTMLCTCMRTVRSGQTLSHCQVAILSCCANVNGTHLLTRNTAAALQQGYEQYQLCVEEHLRGLVRTFIVSCIEDKNELIKLMASHPETRKLTIIMGKQSAAPHSIPQYSDVLQMSSVVVFSNVQVQCSSCCNSRVI